MKNNKILFHMSWLSAIYFLCLFINQYITKFQFILIGFVQELITIPLMMAQPLIFIASLICWKKEEFKIKRYSFWASIISLCTGLITIGSVVLA